MKLGPKLSETVKGKLSLGKRIIQQGGRGNIFKQIFGVNQGEELLKASQCYLSTTVGPISGLLFISTEKLAFCSERSIIVPCATNNTQLVTTPYKVIKHNILFSSSHTHLNQLIYLLYMLRCRLWYLSGRSKQLAGVRMWTNHSRSTSR